MKKKNKKTLLVWAFVGENLSGKTVTIVQKAKLWKKKNKNGKIICFDPHYIIRKDLKVNYAIEHNTKDWEKELMTKVKGKYKYRNSLLILDSYRLLMQSNSTPADFLSLLQIISEANIKIIISTSHPDHILERISYYINKYSVFYMEENDNFSEKAPQYIHCQKAKELVRVFVGKRNVTSYYPHFPHITITKGIFQYINMNNNNYKPNDKTNNQIGSQTKSNSNQREEVQTCI